MGNELDLFDVESIKDEIKEEENMTEEQDMMPAHGSDDWNDYVMSKFKDNEQFPSHDPVDNNLKYNRCSAGAIWVCGRKDLYRFTADNSS